uniref:Uncharacterized protein n=1 Tax=Trypanosoma vivax (strain Y486) TaxID=1055687 RepID=G0U964_TRYVY|nr:hypothetical protein TVY486_1116320 [Trypanosoma vivax Y486]
MFLYKAQQTLTCPMYLNETAAHRNAPSKAVIIITITIIIAIICRLRLCSKDREGPHVVSATSARCIRVARGRRMHTQSKRREPSVLTFALCLPYKTLTIIRCTGKILSCYRLLTHCSVLLATPFSCCLFLFLY